jgi:hypothetical protein
MPELVRMPPVAEIRRRCHNAAMATNPRLEPFSPFIGVWRTMGSHPQMPGQVLEGRTSFDWHEGGAFVIMRSEMRQPEVPAGVSIFGSDDNGAIAMIYFDERGVSRHYEVGFEDGWMKWRRDDPKISQTMRLTVGEGGTTISHIGRISQEGGPWEDDLTLTYHLVSGDQAGRGPAG